MPSSDAQEVDAPTCKRCNQAYVVECGYEPSKHGFCWPCCDEIVEKLFAILDDDMLCVQLEHRQRVGPPYIDREGVAHVHNRITGNHAQKVMRAFLDEGIRREE